MNIKKYLKKTDGDVFVAEWNIIKTNDNDSRGYTINGIDGKFLTVLSTFIEDAGKNILSISPFENPGLEKYEEISEEEYNEILKEKQDEQFKIQQEEDRKYEIQHLKLNISQTEERIKKQEKILQAVKDNILYGGDLELMTALHNFDENTLNTLKTYKQDLEERLKELESVDGE